MLIEIEELDCRSNGNFSRGIVVASDGVVLSEWYYYETDGVAEVWFEDDPDFWNVLSHDQQAFLERRVTIEVEKAVKDQNEFDTAYLAGGLGP